MAVVASWTTEAIRVNRLFSLEMSGTVFSITLVLLTRQKPRSHTTQIIKQTMGNQASVCSPSHREATKPASVEQVIEEAGKLFAMELLGDERYMAAGHSTRCTSKSHHQPALQTSSNLSSRCNLRRHTESTLLSVLEAASRDLDLGRDEDEGSASTRDTCDSPHFPPRTNSTSSKLHRGNTNPPDEKIHPGSLLAHLGFHPATTNSSGRPNRRSSSEASNYRRSSSAERMNNNISKMHQAPPIFPDLSSSPANHSSQANTTVTMPTRSKVVKIPRRNKQQYQAEIEEEEHLKRLYDNRTWTMYKRITEARAARQPTPAAAAHIGNPSAAPGSQSQAVGLHNNNNNDEASLSFLHGPENVEAGYPLAEDDEMAFGDLED